jgi:RNA-binding protein
MDRRALSAKHGTVPIALTNPEKRALKMRAQSLEPIVKLGHAGLSDAFVASLNTALVQHELVKMKFTDFKDQKHELAPQIAERTESALVMQVGNVAVFYRPKPDTKSEGGTSKAKNP